MIFINSIVGVGSELREKPVMGQKMNYPAASGRGIGSSDFAASGGELNLRD